MANVDFEFDFEKALSKAYRDDEIYNDICDVAKALDNDLISTEKAIRELIKINSSVLAEVLKKYNSELLNEL